MHITMKRLQKSIAEPEKPLMNASPIPLGPKGDEPDAPCSGRSYQSIMLFETGYDRISHLDEHAGRTDVCSPNAFCRNGL